MTTANTVNLGTDPMFAHNDNEIPNPNATHAAQRPPPWLGLHSSTVAVVNSPSTINGQIDAVDPSAPKRSANSRPCR